MKTIIFESACGILSFNESNECTGIIYNELTPKELASKYLSIKNEEIPAELKELIHTLANEGYTQIEVENINLKRGLASLGNVSSSIIDDEKDIKSFQQYLLQHLESQNVSITQKQYNQRSKILAEYIASHLVADRFTEHDLFVKEAIEQINELDRGINTFYGRLREWYGLHFPELTDKLINDNSKFTNFVKNIGKRSNINKEDLIENYDMTERRAQYFMEKAERSMGGDVTDKDMSIIQKLAQKILELEEFRTEIEDYISDLLGEIAPNLKEVLGSQITGKLLTKAGSLKSLAAYSSSTIQLLGAEKALFKALNSKSSNTPKYGVLFQWSKIRTQKPYLRGKIARMVSGKISILAKVDYYKGEFIGEEYKRIIDEKIEHIKKNTKEKY